MKRVEKWVKDYDSVMLLVMHLDEVMEDRPQLRVHKEDYDSYVRLWDEGKLRLIHHRSGPPHLTRFHPILTAF